MSLIIMLCLQWVIGEAGVAPLHNKKLLHGIVGMIFLKDPQFCCIGYRLSSKFPCRCCEVSLLLAKVFMEFKFFPEFHTT